ncbi:carbon monoxide dehydrogenase subunit G [Micromonospora sp. A202]|uniref:SRPBCC family protein n=1 Tax=Micromonospora sp. A202 TaxID=2572899 RepID=UPI00114F6BED|nr:SRPBCC family protein [Micromonospora sp. A202]TQJ23194.1 carbon monoxide dehydrogenase subunit G [Micromonospora sp. A202]
MKITNEFAVAVPIDEAWAVLTDLEGIAPCLPGAQLTGVDGDVYRGRVKVKVGPVISEFAGTARFVEKDDAAYRGVIDAKGRDARSTGNASALVTAHLRPDGDRTLVSVDTDLKISGKLAQFGSGMIKEVSGKLVAQFVANLEAKLAADHSAPAVPAARAESEPVAPSSVAPEALPAASATAVATTPRTAAVAPSPIEPSPASSTSVSSPILPSLPSAPAASSASSSASSSAVESPDGSTRVEVAAEPEALDLLSIAGGSITKRLVPVVVGLVAVGAVIAWLASRR